MRAAVGVRTVAVLLAARDRSAQVRVASRQRARAEDVCGTIRAKVAGALVEPVETGTAEQLQAALADQQLVVAAGAAGAVLLPKAARLAARNLRLAIDLNAVPPLGIEGVQVTDKGAEYDGVLCYGAIGVGETKMKVHKAAVARLFESNDQVMDAEEVYALAAGM